MSNSPVRVLHVISGMGMGGVETWLLELLRIWAKRSTGVQTDLLLTGGVPDLLDDEAHSLGARLHYIHYSRLDLATFARDFRTLLRQEQYDAIHDHSDYAAGWRFMIGIGRLPPVCISHVHNPRLHIDANYAVTRSRRFLAATGRELVKRLATHICGTSREILCQYGFPPGSALGPQISTLHCGIDIAKFNGKEGSERASVLDEFGWPRNSKLVLFAGRLDRALEFDHPQNHKNSWLALNIARAAFAMDPDIRLLIAGDGSSRPELERYVSAWGLSAELRLVGIRRDIDRLMKAADVLLFPSRQEGLGMVPVEAQAAGLPVLASTAVPHEAMVVPSLYDTVALGETTDVWAEALLDRIAKPRPTLANCRAALEASGFNIKTSAHRLEFIYRQGKTEPMPYVFPQR